MAGERPQHGVVAVAHTFQQRLYFVGHSALLLYVGAWERKAGAIE